MAKYIPPHLCSAQQIDNNRSPSALPQGWGPQPATCPRPAPPSGADSTDDNTPVWRRRAAVSSNLSIPSIASARVHASSDPALFATSSSSSVPLVRSQTPKEEYKHRTYERTCQLLQPKPIKAEQCEKDKECAQWAGGYVEINDKLFSLICPCNLVGKPCAFDESKQLPAGLAKDKAFRERYIIQEDLHFHKPFGSLSP